METITCDICGNSYEDKNDDSVCPDCFRNCSDPGFHNGESCDWSC